MAAAAYRSGDTLTNEWDGITHDYSKKHWIEHQEILLPPNAPDTFKDRSVLWNAVEKAEKSGNAQLAREVEIALPVELSPDEQRQLVRSYIEENFVSKGMCADFAIHNPPLTDAKGRPLDLNGKPTNDKDQMIFQNPHVHILLTMRPLDREGNWEPKSRTVYLCRREKEEQLKNRLAACGPLERRHKEELKEKIFQGEIEDSKTIASILAYDAKYCR